MQTLDLSCCSCGAELGEISHECDACTVSERDHRESILQWQERVCVEYICLILDEKTVAGLESLGEEIDKLSARCVATSDLVRSTYKRKLAELKG